MKLSTLLVSTVATFAIAGAAVASDKTSVKAETSLENKDNGGYTKETTVEKNSPSGTVKDETKVDVKVKDNGDTDKTATTEHVNDPKGLMNKHTSKTKTEQETKDGKTKTKHTKTVDGNTVENTTETTY